jgi:triosephosphate isomerase
VTLPAVAEVVRGTGVALGAQNLHWETQGAFTGEVSGPMLREGGSSMVIIGHSERRQLFGDTNDWVARKLRAALEHELTPIVCVGETLDEREAGKTWDVVSAQIVAAYGELTADAAGKTVVAYEPVWAIGTGRVATPEQAVEVHARIRSWMKHRFGEPLAAKLRILYGGSVKPGNAADLLGHEEIDGALVGGASLEAGSFLEIAAAAPVGA